VNVTIPLSAVMGFVVGAGVGVLAVLAWQKARDPEDPVNWSPHQRSVYAFAIEVFGSDEAARRWMHNPAPLLDGVTPLEYACTADRANEVKEVLGRLKHGTAA